MFKTSDGYTYDENGTINLGFWITYQRKTTPVESKRGQLLLEIGMRFENKNSTLSWEEMYNYAKIYYEHHHNLEVPHMFKTSDGYTYDENGKINLGTWIAHQRRNTPVESKRGQLLLEIGMIWCVKKNKQDIINICVDNDIDYVKNKNILNHISKQELQSKIEFFKAYNIRLVDNNGVLIDIFSMSNPDMKEKYGISLEELISEYYIKNQKNKGA